MGENFRDLQVFAGLIYQLITHYLLKFVADIRKYTSDTPAEFRMKRG